MVRSISELWTYPGVKLFIVLAAGVFAGDSWSLTLPETWSLLLFVFCCCGIVLLAPYFRRMHAVRLSALALLGFLLGATLQVHTLATFEGGIIGRAESGEMVALFGTAVSEPEFRPHGYSVVIETDSIEEDGVVRHKRGKVLVFIDRREDNHSAASPVRGAAFAAHGWLRLPREATAPEGFDYREHLNRSRIAATFFIPEREPVSITGSGSWIWRAVHSARNYIHHSIMRYAAPEHRGILTALLLGDTGMIDPATADAFRVSGAAHILAVSGLHTGIIFLILQVLFLRFPSGFRLFCILAGLLFYALLTGFAPPVVRASIIAAVFLGGRAMQRSPHPVNTLAIAGIVILLYDPQALFTVSFQLSFLAVLGIALFYQRIDSVLARLPLASRFAPIRWLRSTVSLTIAAQAGTLPILITVFHSVSIVSLATNLAAIPAAFAAVFSAVASLCLLPVSEAAGIIFMHSSDASIMALMSSTKMLAGASWAEIHIPGQPLWIWAGYIAIVLYLAFGKTRLRNRMLVSALAVIVCITAGKIAQSALYPPVRMEIAFLDVGQGDAAVIRTPNGKIVLIDAGPNYRNSDAGARVVLPYLRSQGIGTVDALILTHADDDHIGGADAILAGMHVRHVYYCGLWTAKPSTRPVDSIIDARRIPATPVYRGDGISIDSAVRMYALHPGKGEFPVASSNDASIILLLRYGGITALFAGDADIHAERMLAGRFGSIVRADILKIAHHGSASGTSEELLGVMRPSAAVISCGRHNRYRHPAKRVLYSLSRAGARVYRTDVNGTVIFETDGSRYWYKPWK